MQMQRVNKQQGFTIIELVVVILLLGILAATALPRFIDVTTQAHDSAFEATAGGFLTGTALYRAEWVARGQPAAETALSSYNGLRVAPGYQTGAYSADADGAGPNDESSFTGGTFAGPASGYPYANATGITEGTFTQVHCAQVFEGVLQQGAPSIASSATDLTIGTEATFISEVEAAQTASAADFQVFIEDIEFDTGFARNGSELSGTPGDPSNYADNAKACVFVYSAEAENFNRSIIYVPWTGQVSVFRDYDDLAAGVTYSGPTQ